jgi:hypothetical protein
MSSIRLAVIIGMSGVLISCGHLSRSDARAQLDRQARQQEFPIAPNSVWVRIGTVSGNCYNTPQADVLGARESILSAAGYITVRQIKDHSWDVELTELGNRSIVTTMGKYGHTQKTDCDFWQVSFELSKFNHLDVTGIVEDGVHAKVDALLTFIITPVGMAARKVASPILLELAKKTYGERLTQDSSEAVAQEFVRRNSSSLLGQELTDTPKDTDRYIKPGTFEFDKYDDGWKISTKDK